MAAKKPPQIPGETPADAEQPTDTTLEPMQAETPADAEQPTDTTLEPMQAEAPAQPELPRAADIDATKINRSVLTQDGWVCPA